MRKLLTLSLLALFALTAGMAQANVLGNPGFETVPVGGAGDWDTFLSAMGVAQHSTVDPRSGTGHMDVQVGGTNQFAVVSQLLTPVSPGNVVTFTGWHKSLIPFNATRELKLEWQGAPQLRIDSLVVGLEYEQFSIVGVAPAGTTGVRASYALSNFGAGQGEANVYVDDFEVTITPEPASVMLGFVGLLGLASFIRRR